MPYRIDNQDDYTGLEIAIIGMSGRFPGVQNVGQLWEVLVQNQETITHFDKSEIHDHTLGDEIVDHPDYVRARGVVEGIDCFDAPLFGFSPQEAELLDPQVREFHECAWEALEDASYNPYATKASIGVFAGAHTNAWWENSVLSGYNDTGGYANKDYLATRLSYRLNLRGPSQTIYTACSTAMVAVHMACRSLLNGECDMALAGASAIELTQERGYLYREGDIKSKTGHNKSFDASADGTVFSNGTGVVVLKLLEDAIEDRDNILGVIKGSAINNDGGNKVSYEGPSVYGQTDVVKKALAFADVAPENLAYVEAHGSATNMGDAMEVKALKQAFGPVAHQTCGIGSVKSNLGHTNTVSGLAGMMKAVLAIQHRLIPKTLHYTSPNPGLEIEQSPFYVVAENEDISERPFPVQMGVCSIGVGGTNAHVILEEAPVWEAERTSGPVILAFSAKSEGALSRNIQAHQQRLTSGFEGSLADYSFSLNRREAFGKRAFVVVDTTAGETWTAPQYPHDDHTEAKDVVFAFGHTTNVTSFRLLTKQYAGLLTVVEETYAAFGTDTTWEQETNGHVLAFTLQFALGKFLMNLGVYPTQMVAQGIGELVALALRSDLTPSQAYAVATGNTLDQSFEIAEEYFSVSQQAYVNDTVHLGTIAQSIQKGALPWDIDAMTHLQNAFLVHFSEDTTTAGALLLGAENTLSTFLHALGKLWISGSAMNWDLLYGPDVRKISIPTYSFDQHRYWIKEADFATLRGMKLAAAQDAGQAQLWQPLWTQHTAMGSAESMAEQHVAIIGENDGNFEAFQQIAQAQFKTVTAFHSAQNRTDFEVAFQRLREKGQLPQRIFFLATESVADQALINCLSGFDKAAQNTNVSVHVVTQNLYSVIGAEPVQAQLAPLLNTVQAISHAYPGIQIQWLDYDTVSGFLHRPSLLVNALTSDEKIIAVRHGKRWVQSYKPIPKPQRLSTLPLFEDQGNYLFLGDWGKNALQLAAYISQFAKANFYLADHQLVAEDAQSRALIASIQGKGATLTALRVDNSDAKTLAACWRDLHTEGKQVHGVLYSVDEQEKDYDFSQLECLADQDKVVSSLKELVSLFEATHAPNFCILNSSLTNSINGTYHTAIDSYLGVLASQQNGVTKWLSLHWDTWAHGNEQQLPPHHLSSESATVAFHQALILDEATQVVISDGDLAPRLAATKAVSSAASDSLPVEFTGSKLEVVRSIWAKYLSLDTIADDDDFFKIGGNSMRLLSVIDDISRHFHRKISLKEFYKHSQLKALVSILDASEEHHLVEIPPAPIQKYYPLSPAQHRMYFQYSISPEDTNYNERKLFELSQDTDLTKLKGALQKLADRHEALRTEFVVQGEEVVQTFLDSLTVSLTETNIDHADILKYAAEILLPFDLSQAPLWRAEVVNTADGKQYLITDFHHIIYDGVSMGILQSDLLLLYNGQQPEPITLQYKDYAAYTDSRAYQESLAIHKETWRALLAGHTEAVMIPYDVEGQTELVERSETTVIPTELYRQIELFCLDHSVTTSTFMAAIFNVLLSRFGNTDDATVGLPLHGRISTELANTVGMFVNVLPFRTKIPKEGTFAIYLEEAQQTHLKIIDSQEYAFNDLVKDLKDQAGITTDLFKVLFNMVVKSMTTDRSEGLTNIIQNELTLDESRVSKYEIIMNVAEQESHIILKLDYPANKYHYDTVTTLLKTYQTMIEQVVANPAIPMDQLTLEATLAEPEFDASLLDEEMDF